MFLTFLIRLFDISKMFFSYGIIFFVFVLIILDIVNKKIQFLPITIFGFNISYLKQNKLKSFTYIYVLAAFAGAYSMVLSPTFPSRAYFIIIVFSVISFYQIFLQRNIIIPKYNRVIFIILSMLFIFLADSLLDATRGIIGVYLRWYERIEYINSEISKNNFDLEVPLIPARNKYNALYGLKDLKENKDKNVYSNSDIAKYFDLNSISRNEIEHYELSLKRNFKKIIFPAWLFKYPQ